MTTPINIDPEQLQMMANRIDAWAVEIRDTVWSTIVDRANQEVAQVQSLPNFESTAADAYKAKFEEITNEIKGRIAALFEDVTDNALAGMRDQLTTIGRSFQDLDESFSF